MADLHRTLRVLRGDEDAGRAPGAGLADLDELVELSRASGLPLSVVVDGTPRELEPMLDQSAYRIVQEAVTNVLKHADRAPTTITLGYGRAALELTIADEGELRITDHRGHGLVGMRERAAMFGGTLDAGPRDGRGFVVRAVLPYEAGA